ncbi:NTP pyrophosphatase (non-canonical NTP hydrolase) [Bradyrhizobium sp. USDA 4341]
MRPDIGKDLHDVLRAADSGPSTVISDHLLARTGGRLLEEAVETALDCGLSASGVLTHVMDAIHNECRKRASYPSAIDGARADQDSLTGELGDMAALVQYIRHIADISPEALDAAAEAKLEKLRAKLASGELYVSDGLMYTYRAQDR